MLYSYEAFNRNGGLVTGEVEAASEKDVVLYLESKNLIPSKIRAHEHKKGLSLSMNLLVRKKVKSTEIIFLVRNLATAVKAGLSMSESMDILINDTKPGFMRDILMDVKAAIQAGQPLSEAFGKYKDYFPPVFIGLLRAGEVASELDKTLEELSNHLIKEYSLIKKVRSALVYPALLLITSIGVIIFLLTFVLPRLAKTFEQSGTELPWITEALIASSNFIVGYWYILVVLIGLAAGGFIYMKRTPWGNNFLAEMAERIPVLNDLIHKVALVRFTRTLGSLLGGATPVLEALQTSSRAVGNLVYGRAISDSAEKVRTGVPLSRTLQAYPKLFPVLLTSLIAVGERTGNLEYVLATFSDFYDEEVESKLKDLTTLFEPILLVVMGLVVGGVALSVLLPIYQLVGDFT